MGSLMDQAKEDPYMKASEALKYIYAEMDLKGITGEVDDDTIFWLHQECYRLSTRIEGNFRT